MLILVVMAACSKESSVAIETVGEQLIISPSDYRIRFVGATWSSVVFEHKEHADRFSGDCYNCHNCADFVGESHWNCRECHAPSDPEGLCIEDNYHSCVMTQCKHCHDEQNLNPGLLCGDCHHDGITLEPPADPEEPSAIFVGAITALNQVDHWMFSVAGTTNVIIDIEAWESCGNKPIPMDFFSNGNTNDRLTANIHLFTQGGTVIGSATGMYPGDSAPGAHSSRSGVNPYLALNTLPAGQYTLAIGSGMLSTTDAWAGTNTETSNNYWFGTDFDGSPNYNNYRIKIFTHTTP